LELIDQILAKLQDTSDPTIYYIIGGIALIIFLIFLRKTLYIAIIIVALVVIYFGVSYITGYTIDFTNLSTFHITDLFNAVKQAIESLMGAPSKAGGTVSKAL
jgi:hypothetical protein